MHKEILLKKMEAKDIRSLLIENPSIISQDAPINELLAKINEDLRTRHVYVVDKENKLIGAVRMNSIVQYLFPMSAIIQQTTDDIHHLSSVNFQAGKVFEIMNKNPSYVFESTNLAEMATILMKEKINELPVVDKDMKIIGQVNVYELILAYLEKLKQ
jgi:CBS domain-containing protein